MRGRRKTATKETATKKTATKKTAAKKTAAKKTAAKKTTAKKTTAKNSAAKNSAAKDSAAKNSAAKNSAVKSTTAGKSMAAKKETAAEETQPPSKAVADTPSTRVDRFCRQVEARSHEHGEAMRAAALHQWRALAIGILRQELDSMVRVIYLLSWSDRAMRTELIRQAVEGEQWKIPTAKGKLKTVTDRDMVELAQNLHGWTRSVYRFGCGFIHLSALHDYQAIDPYQALPLEERIWIADHLRGYHGGPISSESSFDEVADYAPRVLGKISSNLRCYVDSLRNDEELDRF